MTLGKLAEIKEDLVRTDPDWESWDFAKLSEAVRHWVKRNPAVSNEKEHDERKSIFHAREDEARVRGCVYCEDTGHKATQCVKVTGACERKKILARKGLCFNCATRRHRASEYSSKSSCQHCNKRLHSSVQTTTSISWKREEIDDRRWNWRRDFPSLVPRRFSVQLLNIVDAREKHARKK